MPQSNLLPCPFCGSEAKFVEHAWRGHGEGGTLWKAQCSNKDCGAELTSRAEQYPYNQEKELGCDGAAAMWNKRAAATDEETERALAARLAATEAASRLAEHGFQDIAHTILNALSLLDATVRRLAGMPPKT